MLCKAPRDRDPFGFTGGLDAGNGMWKLGARFYDSTKNSFIQQERYMGDPSDPLSPSRRVLKEPPLVPSTLPPPSGGNEGQAGKSSPKAESVLSL